MLVIVNSASVNVGCRYLFELEFCLDICPGVGLLNLNGGSADKESACNEGHLGSIPGLRRSAGEGEGCPLQCSDLENHGLYSPRGRKESDTTGWLSLLWHLYL